ncbi:hypothetical protein [Fluviicola sp.]|uniref:hypothetical protein n=1 Tax=Fluviicola sp. TaxID=1917219 RepID=UPI003D2BBF24
MKLITLWSIIIKIFGVYFAYGTIMMLVFYLAAFNINKVGPAGFVVFIVEAVFAYMFLFRTDSVIKRFHLEESIPEKRIDANIESSKILQIAIAVIGIYSLTQSIPEFLGNLQLFASKLTLLSLLKVILGFLLVTKSSALERWVSRNQSK